MANEAGGKEETERQVEYWLLGKVLMMCDYSVTKNMSEDELRITIEQVRQRIFAIAKMRNGEPANLIELLCEQETRYQSLSEQENTSSMLDEEREGYRERQVLIRSWLAVLNL